jgi:hypothetical protein
VEAGLGRGLLPRVRLEVVEQAVREANDLREPNAEHSRVGAELSCDLEVLLSELLVIRREPQRLSERVSGMLSLSHDATIAALALASRRLGVPGATDVELAELIGLHPASIRRILARRILAGRTR